MTRGGSIVVRTMGSDTVCCCADATGVESAPARRDVPRCASSRRLHGRAGACRLNGKFQLEEIRRRSLHLAHPGLGGARDRQIIGLYLDALAALLLWIDAHLVGFLVRRSFSLFLLATLFFLCFEVCLDDCLVVFDCRCVL